MTDVEPADVVALLQSHLNGDDEAVGAMLCMVGPVALFGATVGFMTALIGTTELQHALNRWREQQLGS